MCRQKKAFTFIELLVVLSIISILTFLTAPRLVTIIKPKRVEAFSYQLRDTLEYLNESAILRKNVYLFIFDREQRSYYFRVSELGNLEGTVKDRYLRKVDFPEFLKVKKLEMQPGGEIIEGRMIIPFTPKGILYSFLIILSDGKRDFVISGSALNSKIELKQYKQESY